MYTLGETQEIKSLGVTPKIKKNEVLKQSNLEV